MSLVWAHGLIALAVVQRLAELVHARRNTEALLARGGRETGAAHYPLFILLQGAWLVALAVLATPDPPRWAWLGLFLVLQALRLWVIAALGPYWTTRIITIDGEPPVRTGPYRYLRHPNYLIVALEIPAFSLALGLPWVGLAFGGVNAILLLYRIGVEDAARDGAAHAAP